MPPLNARAPFFNLMGYCPISYAFFLRMERPFPPAHLFYSVWAHSAAPVEMGRINHLSGFLLHHVFNLVPRTVMLLRRVFFPTPPVLGIKSRMPWFQAQHSGFFAIK